MRTGLLRKGLLVCGAGGALAASLLASPLGASASPAPAYSVTQAAPYGGEPSIVSDNNGVIYVDSPSLGLQVFNSTDHGQTFAPMGVDPDPNSGDNCLATDQTNALYECNLNGTPSTGPLQADVWKTTDMGQHWLYGNNAINQTGTQQNNCGTSCDPFMVDRQWVDATSQTGMTATQTGGFAAISYHDFSAQSHVYVNLTDDGGATWTPPEDILANMVPGADAAQVLADTGCSTVPANTRISKGGAHPGRMFVAWLASDPSSAVTGCNFTQAQAFHTLIVAYADPPFNMGTTSPPTPPTIQWHAKVAADIGVFHDASTPFVSFTTDNQGNPYFGYAANANSQPQDCSVPLNPQTAECEYDMYVVWSPDGGTTWTSPDKVNTDSGTHFWPAIGATDPGHVWLAWLRTPSVIPTDANGKEHPGSCFAVAATCTFTGQWSEFVAQSSDLLSGATPNPTPTWAITAVPNGGPMHQGDICNLGIACVPTISNRNLLDFQTIAIDPLGCAHIAYPDDKTNNKVMVANQTAGCVAPALGAALPETPSTLLIIPVAVGAAAAFGLVASRRRRRRGSPEAG